MTASSDPSAQPVADDPAELDRFLDAYTPTTLTAEQWQPIAPTAIALVKGAGPYKRVRVQNDISVIAHVAARLLERGRPLTLDEALADSTLLDFDGAQQRAGVANATREKARGILRRLQAAHHGVPWRRQRRADGERVADLAPPTLATDLARVVMAAQQDCGAEASALLAAVDVARRARRGETTDTVTADPLGWSRARAFAHRQGVRLTAASLAAAVTHEVLLDTHQPLAVIAATAQLSRRDLDLGLTQAAALEVTPTPAHRAALRGTSAVGGSW